MDLQDLNEIADKWILLAEKITEVKSFDLNKEEDREKLKLILKHNL